MAGKKCFARDEVPEIYVTRPLLYPETLKSVRNDLAERLGHVAVLFAPTEYEIPLFKVSALPSYKDVKTTEDAVAIAAELGNKIADIVPEVSVPTYFNALPTLFMVDHNKDIGYRLRNNYAADFVPETVQDQYGGGQVDYMVHHAVDAVRAVFTTDPIGPDHRGYINGRDRRMKAEEIFDYLKLGELVPELFEDRDELLALQRNPQEALEQQGLVLDFPEQVVFGAMQVRLRNRKQNRHKPTIY
jgi:hypothetical protein